MNADRPAGEHQWAEVNNTRLASHSSTNFGLGRLEPVRQRGTTLDLTALPSSRRVLLPERDGTPRGGPGLGEPPGNLLPKASRVPTVAPKLTEDDCWCLEGQQCPASQPPGNEVDTKETLE